MPTPSADFAPPALTVISEASANNSFHGVEGESDYATGGIDFSDLASVIATSNFDGSNSSDVGAYMRTGLAVLILANAALLSWLLLGHRWMMLTPRSLNAKR